MALLRRPQATFLQVIQVVPAVLVERVRHHRRAEQVTHLAASHSHLQLRDGSFFEEIALLNRHSIDAALQSGTCRHSGKRKGQRGKESAKQRAFSKTGSHVSPFGGIIAAASYRMAFHAHASASTPTPRRAGELEWKVRIFARLASR